MIKEITKIIKDSKNYTGVMMKEVDNNLQTVFSVISADTYVDDDFNAEYKLQNKLINLCKKNNNVEEVNINKSIPENMSKVEHYTDIIELLHTVAQMKIYKNTKRSVPNYVICSADFVPLFTFCRDFQVLPISKVHGTYLNGMFRNIPVLISPILDRGEMLWGVNDETSPGIVTFVNDKNKICNKIINDNCFTLVKLEENK